MDSNNKSIDDLLEEILKISFEKAKNGDVDFAKINELVYIIKKKLLYLK